MNEDMINAFIAHTEKGLDVETAAYAAQINPRTILRVIEQGYLADNRHADRGGHILKRDIFAVELYRRYTTARAQSLIFALDAIRSSAQGGDWKAAKFLLEVSAPAIYGRTAAMGETGANGLDTNNPMLEIDVR